MMVASVPDKDCHPRENVNENYQTIPSFLKNYSFITVTYQRFADPDLEGKDVELVILVEA